MSDLNVMKYAKRMVSENIFEKRTSSMDVNCKHCKAKFRILKVYIACKIYYTSNLWNFEFLFISSYEHLKQSHWNQNQKILQCTEILHSKHKIFMKIFSFSYHHHWLITTFNGIVTFCFGVLKCRITLQNEKKRRENKE